MNSIAYRLLLVLCVATEIWGIAIDAKDVTLVGAIAGCGVIGVDRLLLRADRYEEFAEAGEER
ncbi:hypothetical protein KV205_05250 [Streptomyces sp. SKN60]|uniref:hypothetical protein n=1 Tax=Streptomyces sp. SKN60 TaxID=2855506 RepID=UPI00224769F0|nr:hypothetical protein [Streptomyces sp. SKN60]MCX2179938.1 hypothetical protein [Streptomyces sp. SKN60]